MDCPGFYFCLCPDAALSREHVTDLLAQLASQSEQHFEQRTWWGEEGLDSRFWESLTLQGLTDKPRALVVRGAHTLPAETWKKLSATLSTPRSGILPLFLMESAWEKGQPKLPAHVGKLKCLEFAEKKKWIWRSPGLTSNTLRRHVQERAQGLIFDGNALDVLCSVLALDAASVQGVLEQLTLAATPDDTGARHVTVDLARQMTAHTPEVLIFDFIRYLQEGNRAAVWKTLLAEGDGGEAMLFPLLALLARETRTLWQIHAGEDVWLPQHLAGAKRALAMKVGKSGLSHIFASIMEAEWAVKSGRRQPLQALEGLVAELTLIFSPVRA